MLEPAKDGFGSFCFSGSVTEIRVNSSPRRSDPPFGIFCGVNSVDDEGEGKLPVEAPGDDGGEGERGGLRRGSPPLSSERAVEINRGAKGDEVLVCSSSSSSRFRVSRSSLAGDGERLRGDSAAIMSTCRSKREERKLNRVFDKNGEIGERRLVRYVEPQVSVRSANNSMQSKQRLPLRGQYVVLRSWF